MIRNLEDLKEKMQLEAIDFDEDVYKKSFLIVPSRINNDKMKLLQEKLPNLPTSYSKLLHNYNFFEVEVGYFSLSPLTHDLDNIVDSLIKAQTKQDSFLPRSLLDRYDLYWVGTNNNDTIYVAGKNSKFLEGEVIAIHEFILNAEEKDCEQYILRLAQDFEQFLIIAGNLNEIYRTMENTQDREEELFKCLKLLQVDRKYYDSWAEYL